MAGSSSGEDMRKETSRANEYFAQANYQPGMMVPPHCFTQHLYYPYVNPYSHLTEANGNLSIHGYGSDGRPKYRRSRTIFNPEQMDILDQHFEKYKYPDVKRRRIIAEEVGLGEERVQVWFQNRRAKNKRQVDQQVKLEKLVNQAIGTNADQGNGQNLNRNSDHGFPVSCQNGEEYQESLFGRPQPHDVDNESENDDNRIFHTTGTKFPRLQECPLGNDYSRPNSSVASTREIVVPGINPEERLPEKAENSAGSENSWLQPNASSFGSAAAQVVVQSIDQDLLCKVANILSASNDANSMISEWSQSPNKVHTNNLEEQLRHFAEHHKQVLTAASQHDITTLTASNQSTLAKD